MRILSGIQPTGEMHIGNYFGAAKNWVQLQDGNDCIFAIVDLHALTVPQDPNTFKKATLEKTMELLAVGLDPERCVLFVQSQVQEHTELAWLLNTITPVAELERMTQYKDKARKHRQNINMGLLAYPVLQAADILLYRAEGVPVGKDQIQHLELTRQIARKFNAAYGKAFVEPEALVPKEGANILSLSDPKRKMSKSDASDSSISPFESPEAIRKKVMGAVTDAEKEVKYHPTRKPGVSNLLTIYSLFAQESVEDSERRFAGKGYAAFKKAVADLLADKLEPLRKKKKELQRREVYVEEILKHGAKRARSIAQETMEDVRARMGLLT